MNGEDEMRRVAGVLNPVAGVADFDQLHAGALELLRDASSFVLLVELAPGAIVVTHGMVTDDGNGPTRMRQFAASAENYARTLRDQQTNEGG